MKSTDIIKASANSLNIYSFTAEALERLIESVKAEQPCPTCEALARTVMLDQTSHDAQRKPWVGLTDEEMRDLEKQFNAERVRTSDEEYLIIYPSAYWAWQRAIEAKLREKNNG